MTLSLWRPENNFSPKGYPSNSWCHRRPKSLPSRSVIHFLHSSTCAKRRVRARSRSLGDLSSSEYLPASSGGLSYFLSSAAIVLRQVRHGRFLISLQELSRNIQTSAIGSAPWLFDRMHSLSPMTLRYRRAGSGSAVRREVASCVCYMPCIILGEDLVL